MSWEIFLSRSVELIYSALLFLLSSDHVIVQKKKGDEWGIVITACVLVFMLIEFHWKSFFYIHCCWLMVLDYVSILLKRAVRHGVNHTNYHMKNTYFYWSHSQRYLSCNKASTLHISERDTSLLPVCFSVQCVCVICNAETFYLKRREERSLQMCVLKKK